MKPWPKVRLEEVLRRAEETIELQPDAEYRQITVRLWGKGVVLRGILTGAEIAASRQMVARRGQFILSRIDARNGALGIVPLELDGAIVTNDFPVFNVVEKSLLPAYLGWMCRTASFVEECKRASEGTTNRVRLQEDKFLARGIPLPPLAEQRRVVARIEELAAQMHEARTLRHPAAEEAEALLITARRAMTSGCSAETVALEDACAQIIDNLHSNPRLSETGIPCIRSPDVGYGTLNLESAQRTDEEEYGRRTVRGEPRAGDVVFVREGGGTGKCAVVQPRQRFSLGQRVMMLRPNTKRILPSFFLHQLLSPQIQEDQIAPLSKGSASPHLNIGALRRFNLVLPPLPEQHRIVAELDALQSEVDALRRLQAETAAELDALLPAILDRAFKGEL
ncbi:MAG: restriction endonuclease subunit S [Verrucomicrobia bacterium]|nr:restriction endonuclease subunit S [Verrucomicrobiota bacterium]